MAESRWEWTLRGGVRIGAVLDDARESVSLDGKPVSQAARGMKPEGHRVEIPKKPDDDEGDAARVVTVAFDPSGRICVLTLDGLEVSPSLWPSSKKPLMKEAPPPPFPFRTIATLVIGSALLMALVLFVRARASAPGGDDTMGGVYRAPNGRFVAHFPSAFASRAAVAPRPMSGVVIEDRGRGDAVVIFGAPAGEGQKDVWAVHKRLYGEALANVARASAEHEETKHEDGTCLGKPAALFAARVTNAKGEKARFHSCAFANDGSAYLVAYLLRDAAKVEDERRIARIVEATELTELYDMTDQKP
jgi:hypothetical protein